MGISGIRPEGGERRAFTLIEVLIAALVLVLVIVPLIGLLTSNKTDEQSEEGMSEAVAMCEEMMEKIISNNLPFECIKADGGGGITQAANGSTKQAGFVADTGGKFDPVQLEKIVNDGAPGTERLRTVKGKRYNVYFFAGKYPDLDVTDPDKNENGYTLAGIDKTLTFSYLEKPAGFGLPFGIKDLDRQKFDRESVLKEANVSFQNIEASPYMLRSYLVAGGPSPQAQALTDNERQSTYLYHDQTQMRVLQGKPGQTLVPGWPDPKLAGFADVDFDINSISSDQRAIWSRHLADVAMRNINPSIVYHPVTINQHTFKATGGALMKIVLGVKFFPYDFSALRKQSDDNAREFWLVSLKANLEN